MKNCIIIHGCPSDNTDPSYNKHWIPRLKNELIKNSIPTETPLMPSPWQPVYEDYKKKFEKYPVNEDSILIGHSCGCAFLVRWLGETKQKIAKLILVAPRKINDEWGIIWEKFYTYLIDESIKERVKEIVMFTANDEDPEGKESLQIFHDAIWGKTIELKQHGHYLLGDMGTEKFPELLEVIMQ